MRVVALSVLLLAVPLCLAAQQPLGGFTDAVVVSATGEEQPRLETGGAVTVITADELRASGSAVVAELLRRVPGALVVRSGGEGTVSTLLLRGAASTQTLVLLDGVRLNSPFFGGYDWSLPGTAGLQRVEVVRGPYSALHGSDALGGVVHLVPAETGGRRARLRLEGGDGAFRRGELEAGWGSATSGVEVAAGERRGSGELDNDDFQGRTLMLSARHRLGALRLGALLRRSSGETGIPRSMGQPTPRRSTAATETLAAVPLRAGVAGGELELVLSRVEREMRFRDPDDPWGFVASDTTADSDAARASFARTLGRHRLTVGGEWRSDEVDDASSYGPNLTGRRLDTRSAFVQDRVELSGRLGLLAGARYDASGPWGEALSPRASLTWQGTGGATAWLSYGRAFRAPSLGELYYPMAGNPDLGAERSWSAEVGGRAPLDAATLVELAVFSTRASDLIDFDAARLRFDNVERAEQRGVEASVTRLLGRQGVMTVAATWLDAHDGEGVRLLRRPRWSGAATLRHPLPLGARGELALVWSSSRPDRDEVSGERVRLASHATAALALAAPLAPGLEAVLRIDNLADRSYQEVRGYPAPRRRVVAGLEAVLR